MDYLGTIVKDARIQAGLTQEEIAAKVGVTAQQIRHIENSRRKPSFDVLYDLIRELYIVTDSIFFPERRRNRLELERAVSRLHQCSDKQLNVVTAMLDIILDI